jgi:hypothetical protein
MPHKCNSNSFPVERVRELFDYDPETGYLISKNKRWAGRPVNGYPSADKRVWRVQLYREDGSNLVTNYARAVFAWNHGRWPDGTIDHIDRNPRNNRIENLREADMALQTQNTTFFNYGCSWYEPLKKWAAKIRVNGNLKHLGYHYTQKAAQEAYMAACDEIGRQYLKPYLFNDRYVPEERVMGIR